MFIFLIIGLMLCWSTDLDIFSCKRKLNFIYRVITFLIWILLFLLGTEVGDNKMIIEGLHSLGLEALVITLAAVGGSVLCAWWLWIFISTGKLKGGEE